MPPARVVSEKQPDRALHQTVQTLEDEVSHELIDLSNAPAATPFRWLTFSFYDDSDFRNMRQTTLLSILGDRPASLLVVKLPFGAELS